MASKPAICDGTRELRKEHAKALADSPHDPSVITGALLIRTLDAGCNDQ